VGTSPKSKEPHGSSFNTVGPVSRVAPRLSATKLCLISLKTRCRDKETASEISIASRLENDSKQSVKCQLRAASECQERQRRHRRAGELPRPFPKTNHKANINPRTSVLRN
jgi:hypothetical protein